MPIEEYGFGLNDVKIAVWNSAENYGSAVDVVSVQMLEVSWNTSSGQLEGDDIITDTHAKNISGTVRMRFAFKNLSVIEVLTGVAVVDSPPTSKSMVFGQDNYPYFALAGRVDDTAGGGDLQFFIPKCKIMEGWAYRAEFGGYATPEITAMAVYEGATYGMGKFIPHATAQAITIPPT